MTRNIAQGTTDPSTEFSILIKSVLTRSTTFFKPQTFINANSRQYLGEKTRRTICELPHRKLTSKANPRAWFSIVKLTVSFQVWRLSGISQIHFQPRNSQILEPLPAPSSVLIYGSSPSRKWPRRALPCIWVIFIFTDTDTKIRLGQGWGIKRSKHSLSSSFQALWNIYWNEFIHRGKKICESKLRKINTNNCEYFLF